MGPALLQPQGALAGDTGALDPYYFYKLRSQTPADSPLQAAYGPMEHQQVMQEMVSQNPAMVTPLGQLAIPGYTLGKATGLIPGTRSPASWDEVLQAYKGLWQGLLANKIFGSQGL